MLKNKYDYRTINRIDIDGVRHYECDGKITEALPSVTTILSATESDDKTDTLDNWRKRYNKENGEGAAEQYTQDAADRGSFMHEYLEHHVLGQAIVPPVKKGMKPALYTRTNQAFKMAGEIIKDLDKNLDEAWGLEAALFLDGLYAGTTDCVGLYEGEDAIVDFKQSNKLKRRSWIDDYFCQLTAYGNAHNSMFGTKIRKGVILMCTGDLQFQKFVLEGEEWDKYTNLWFDRVEQYYE